MTKDDDILTADEFFGIVPKPGKKLARRTRRTQKEEASDLFEEVKIQMVMRINGVSRAKALEIIAARLKEGLEADEEEDV